MAGIDRDTPIPSEIKLHQKSRRLELIYENGENYSLDFEYLRVYTPSAEARVHGTSVPGGGRWPRCWPGNIADRKTRRRC